MAKVLITGASSGIGEALSMKLLNEGHHVIACGRDADKLKQYESFPNAQILQFDVSKLTECEAALSDVRADIYVLNAGTCEYVDVNAPEADMFRRVFDINVMGVSNVVCTLLPQCERGNTLVFVESLARLLPFPRSQAYGASKAAVYYMAKSFAVDLARKGINVKTMSPGFVKTPLTDKNDFPMPMQISAEEAANYMYKGLFNSRNSVYFPRRFSWLIRCLGLLPAFIRHQLCVNMSRNMKRNNK